MKKTVLSSLALLLFSAVLTPAVIGAAPCRCVPDEIIVKFRGTAADIIEKQLQLHDPTGIPNFSPLSSHLASLNKKYRLNRIKPLIKDFRSRQLEFESLKGANGRFPAKKQKRILKRLKRVPKTTKVPDLGRIYKIQLDCESRQSLEEALVEYRSNPDVEYAELN